MEAVRITGLLGEELILNSRVLPSLKVTKWLSAVEQSMKTSVQLALEACLQRRLDYGMGLSILYDEIIPNYSTPPLPHISCVTVLTTHP